MDTISGCTINEIGDKGYAEVVGDGVKTYQQALNALYALVDKSKISKTSYMYTEPYYYTFRGYSPSTSALFFENTFSADGVTFYIEGVIVKPSGSIWNVLNMINNRYPQINSANGSTLPIGRRVRIYY